MVSANILAGRRTASVQKINRQRGSEGTISGTSVETDRMAELMVFIMRDMPVRISATRRLNRRTRSDLWMGTDLQSSAVAVSTFRTMAATSMRSRITIKAVNPGVTKKPPVVSLEQFPAALLQLTISNFIEAATGAQNLATLR